MNYNDLNEIEGLQFIPVNEYKQPIVKNWQNDAAKHDLSKGVFVGLVCGKLSGNLECLDIDLKYSLDPKLYEKYKLLVHELDPELLGKLVVQKTISGGYHLIYRCSKIAGNTKLANRPTTEQERQATFQKTYDYEVSKSTPDDKAVKIAEKAQIADKVRVLFETRGTGGQFVCEPSKGYKFVFGDIQSISEITPDQRDLLHGIARQFNEVFEETSYTKPSIKKTDGLSPCDDYNQRGDVVALLEEHGWRVVNTKGNKTFMLRPGQTSALTSGNYDHERKWFSVFTTSTDFKPEKAYLPYSVFAKLECNDNFTEATKKLAELGYGEQLQDKPKEKAQSTRVIPSRVNADDDDYSFLATPADYEEYLHQVRTGTLQHGLTTGSKSLDKHFLFKEGNFVMVNGTDNVGKTRFVWYLLMIAAMYHDWHGVIFASENTLGSFMRAMIQFYWGKQLYGQFAMTDKEMQIAKAFVESHFQQIKAQEDLYNYKDILNMVKKVKKKYPKTNHCMIDPYNSLKVDLSGFSKLNTHEYHYEALSEMKAYGQKNKIGFFINHHAVTAAARAKDGEKKYPIPPGKADTEGGVKVGNKADDFMTIHRVTQHPTEWMFTDVHIRKIKDTETGGRPTPIDNPVRFEMYKGGCGFIEKNETGEIPIDPIQAWHHGLPTEPPKLFVTQTGDISHNWKPYKDDDNNQIDF